MAVMAIDPLAPLPVPARSSYYALPLRGRLFPYEGGTFSSAAPGKIAAEKTASAPISETAPGKSEKTPDKMPGFSFGALLDIVNPLQHIPLVSTLYRRITGDDINPVSRIAGDTLFFGVLGFAGSLINVAMEKITGKDVGDHVMTAMLGEKPAQPKNDINPPTETIIAKNNATEEEDGVANALAAIPNSDVQGGRVTVHPKGGVALDAATLDALARTLGSAEPLAHLAPKTEPDSDKRNPAAATPRSEPVTTYNDALIRMQESMQRYQAAHPAPVN